MRLFLKNIWIIELLYLILHRFKQLLKFDLVAQLVEHLTFNQRVSGSNPD